MPAWPGPASTRCHRRYGPPPGPAAPDPRTGQRNRCATGLRAAGIPRCPHRGATGAGRGSERRMRHRPGDPGVPGRLRWRDPPPGHLGPGLLPQPPREPAPRRHLRYPLGERLAIAARHLALPPVRTNVSQVGFHTLITSPSWAASKDTSSWWSSMSADMWVTMMRLAVSRSRQASRSARRRW
jgi:hypothetical protein